MRYICGEAIMHNLCVECGTSSRGKCPKKDSQNILTFDGDCLSIVKLIPISDVPDPIPNKEDK
jgi:hypothetical protein